MVSERPFSELTREGWAECEPEDYAESLAVLQCPHIYRKKNLYKALQELSMTSATIPQSVLSGLRTKLKRNAGNGIEPRPYDWTIWVEIWPSLCVSTDDEPQKASHSSKMISQDPPRKTARAGT